VVGTAVVARLFSVCRPTLLRVGWFRWGHDWLLGMKERVYRHLKSMPAWQQTVTLKERVKRWVRMSRPGLIVKRWRAIRERLQRRG
jgi:hypothetical protein